MALVGSLSSLIAFVLLLAIFVSPGVVLARRWFEGRELVLCGAGLGYLVSSLVASCLYRFEWASPTTIVAACLLLCAGAMLARTKPESGNRGAEEKDRIWMAAALVFAVALVAVPFLRVGSIVAEGVAYRAYFSADLMTHLSVVAELQKGDFPPENPFYAGEPLGYYWLFFLFPSLVGRWIGNQEALLLTYLAGGLLFSGLAYASARRLTASPARAFVAVAALLSAASYEGLAWLGRSLAMGEAFSSFRNVNVDAFSRWAFELTSLDGAHRSLLYTPQHLFSYSLLLVLILLFLRDEVPTLDRSILAGGLLGGMAGASIVTAMLAGPWFVAVRTARGGPLRPLIRDLLAVGTVSLACLGWYFELGFFGGAGSALSIRSPRALEIPALLVLDCGPLALLAGAAWKAPRLRPVAALAAMSLLAVLSLDIRGYEGVWMAWRAGSVFLISLFLLASVAFARWRPAFLALVLLPGVLTAVLDIFNAQDVSNRNMSAGDFRWTTVVSHSESEALDWIRTETDPGSLVQWDVRAREPGDWALLPALAERRMAVGFPIFLLEGEKYRIRERRHVRPIFTSGDPIEAHRRAVVMGIDYIVVGRRELEVRGERVRGLWSARDGFEPVYESRDVTVFQVLP